MKHVELIRYLEASADALTGRALIEQYKDPFWHARYGERADRHGRADGAFHIKYVVTAIASDDRTVMRSYARWLQQLLTTRGMCTRHLDDNFRLLAEAIEEDARPDRAEAIAMLDAARAGLQYPDGVARTVQDLAPALADRLAPTLCASHPGWTAPECARELATLLSYVADAIALGDPAKFRAHVEWTYGFMDGRGIPRERLAASLATLRTELAGELSPQTLAALFE